MEAQEMLEVRGAGNTFHGSTAQVLLLWLKSIMTLADSAAVLRREPGSYARLFGVPAKNPDEPERPETIDDVVEPPCSAAEDLEDDKNSTTPPPAVFEYDPPGLVHGMVALPAVSAWYSWTLRVQREASLVQLQRREQGVGERERTRRGVLPDWSWQAGVLNVVEARNEATSATPSVRWHDGPPTAVARHRAALEGLVKNGGWKGLMETHMADLAPDAPPRVVVLHHSLQPTRRTRLCALLLDLWSGIPTAHVSLIAEEAHSSPGGNAQVMYRLTASGAGVNVGDGKMWNAPQLVHMLSTLLRRCHSDGVHVVLSVALSVAHVRDGGRDWSHGHEHGDSVAQVVHNTLQQCLSRASTSWAPALASPSADFIVVTSLPSGERGQEPHTSSGCSNTCTWRGVVRVGPESTPLLAHVKVAGLQRSAAVATSLKVGPSTRVDICLSAVSTGARVATIRVHERAARHSLVNAVLSTVAPVDGGKQQAATQVRAFLTQALNGESHDPSSVGVSWENPEFFASAFPGRMYGVTWKGVVRVGPQPTPLLARVAVSGLQRRPTSAPPSVLDINPSTQVRVLLSDTATGAARESFSPQGGLCRLVASLALASCTGSKEDPRTHAADAQLRACVANFFHAATSQDSTPTAVFAPDAAWTPSQRFTQRPLALPGASLRTINVPPSSSAASCWHAVVHGGDGYTAAASAAATVEWGTRKQAAREATLVSCLLAGGPTRTQGVRTTPSPLREGGSFTPHLLKVFHVPASSPARWAIASFSPASGEAERVDLVSDVVVALAKRGVGPGTDAGRLVGTVSEVLTHVSLGSAQGAGLVGERSTQTSPDTASDTGTLVPATTSLVADVLSWGVSDWASRPRMMATGAGHAVAVLHGADVAHGHKRHAQSEHVYDGADQTVEVQCSCSTRNEDAMITATLPETHVRHCVRFRSLRKTPTAVDTEKWKHAITHTTMNRAIRLHHRRGASDAGAVPTELGLHQSMDAGQAGRVEGVELGRGVVQLLDGTEVLSWELQDVWKTTLAPGTDEAEPWSVVVRFELGDVGHTR